MAAGPAQHAWEQGQDAATGGDLPRARAWLERARRLEPDNATIAFALAMVCLRQGDAGAAALFETLARRHDRREAWLGLAACARAAADAAGAGTALAEALSRHAVDPAFAPLLDETASAAGYAGWCGLSAEGWLLAGPAGGFVARDLTVSLDDGRPVRPMPAADGRFRLPRGWQGADRIAVTAAGRALLGSPLAVRAIRRVEGFVAPCDGGLAGWAWYPNDPDTDPEITVQGAGRRMLRLVARDLGIEVPPAMPLARPRGFRLSAADLAGLVPPLRVTGRDGRDLLGSPLDPGLERRAAAAAARAVAARRPAAGRRRPAPATPDFIPVPADVVGAPPPMPRRRPPVAVVIPVYRGLRQTLDCLESVLATVPRGTGVIVVEDASPEPELVAALEERAGAGRIRLIRLARNRGFPGAANAGLRAAAGRDAVLLNSDTLTPPGWLEALRTAAYAAPDTGTVTPLSNDATILSYPGGAGPNPIPDHAAARRLARIAGAANGAETVEIPTGHGFCLYIRHDCLARVGLLREDLFAQGYGEENDFCLRARHLGWRHVAATGAFVAHVGGVSFGAARAALLGRNLEILERLHPGYGALIAAHQAADPLAPARRRMDARRWRAARGGRRAVILVTHDQGGGVERHVQARAAMLRAAGLRPVLLRPLPLSETPEVAPRPRGVMVSEAGGDDFPDLRFALPAEMPALLRLLRGDRPEAVEIHHLLGHDPVEMPRLPALLGVPGDVVVHDYALICPRIALIGIGRRYCGEPDAEGCAACVAAQGSALEEEIAVPALRARSAVMLAAARRVVVPSAEVAARLRRYVRVAPEVVPWEDDAALPAPLPLRPGAGRMRVCVPGAIGVAKGLDLLLACARDAAARDLKLEFVVVGRTGDDAALLATGRAFVTGPYAESEAVALIRAQQAALALIPSVWPETWCYVLTLAWRAGLRAAVFDIGTPATRVRATGWGWCLPLGMPAGAVNDHLLRLRALARNREPEQVPTGLPPTVSPPSTRNDRHA